VVSQEAQEDLAAAVVVVAQDQAPQPCVGFLAAIKQAAAAAAAALAGAVVVPVVREMEAERPLRLLFGTRSSQYNRRNLPPVAAARVVLAAAAAQVVLVGRAAMAVREAARPVLEHQERAAPRGPLGETARAAPAVHRSAFSTLVCLRASLADLRALEAAAEQVALAERIQQSAARLTAPQA